MNESIDYNLFTFNGAVAAPIASDTLGDLLVGNAYDQIAFSGDAAILAWNFTIASLLGRAADQEREKRQVSVRIEVPDFLTHYWPDVLALNLSAAAYVQDELRKQNATAQVLLP